MTNHEIIKMAFSGVKAPEGSADRILKSAESDQPEKPQNLYYKRRFAVVAIAVILAMLVTSTLAYAKILDFNWIYRIVFGENSEYVEQYIEPFVSESATVSDVIDTYTTEETQIVDGEKTSNESPSVSDPQPTQTIIESEYDGIVLRLISAINDGDVLRIFATMQDTTGDRLGNSIDCDNWYLSEGNGGNISVVDYDRGTKTATILITSLGEHPKCNATLNINDLKTDRQTTEGLSENKINIYDALQNHTPQTVSQSRDQWGIWKMGGSLDPDNDISRILFETSDVLKPDELHIIFENIDWAHISNLGFINGYLHIQTALPITIAGEDYIREFKLVNEKNETVYNGDVHISFIEYENRYGYDGSNMFYMYYEIIYGSITDIEQLRGLSVVIDISEQGNTIEGKWEFSFGIPEKITTEFAVGREININGEAIQIETISLSPLGIILDLPINIASYYKHLDIAYVTYEDGTIVELNEIVIQGNEDISILKFGGNIVEIEKVKTIVINDEVISVRPVG